jgi:hypothetical protein
MIWGLEMFLQRSEDPIIQIPMIRTVFSSYALKPLKFACFGTIEYIGKTMACIYVLKQNSWLNSVYKILHVTFFHPPRFQYENVNCLGSFTWLLVCRPVQSPS